MVLLIEEFKDKHFQITDNYKLRKICGEYAIIPVGEESKIQNAIMTPNDTAVSIWKAFQTPSTEDEVVRLMLQEYEGDEQEIRKGVHQFIKETVVVKILKGVD